MSKAKWFGNPGRGEKLSEVDAGLQWRCQRIQDGLGAIGERGGRLGCPFKFRVEGIQNVREC